MKQFNWVLECNPICGKGVGLVSEDLCSIPSTKNNVNLISYPHLTNGEEPAGLGFGLGISLYSRVHKESLSHWLVFSVLPGWSTLDIVGRGEEGSPVSCNAKDSHP